ncbi:hypothetical protein BOX15_Mlig032251g2 [Macrostomum lignano]|uniref:Uncharacterized protein n=2 Tax=Macrostomum lignano TaxID=282301 RepID=A0A267DXI3_9PLAT|nr:hypothetical protein BOX15_Mlig032251g1 [Macrostomum lignano]PAA84474.1 hypothetical protein BOX15_Mlig032251g3 [Macrostomum lignano]PAA84979.1 hypothetical protein BOX15_Mlig032251g2 [Macrostomum lignano]
MNPLDETHSSTESSTESFTEERLTLASVGPLKSLAPGDAASEAKPARKAHSRRRISNLMRHTTATADSSQGKDLAENCGTRSEAVGEAQQGQTNEKPAKTERPKSNSVPKCACLGALFLALAILGDTLRIVDEWYAFEYDKHSFDVSAKVSYTSLVFCLSIASCLSVIGVLGLVLLFLLAVQVAYISKVLLSPSISLLRTMTADECKVVEMLLTDE